MENTSDSLMPRPLLLCLKSEKIVCYSVPDNNKITGIFMNRNFFQIIWGKGRSVDHFLEKIKPHLSFVQIAELKIIIHIAVSGIFLIDFVAYFLECFHKLLMVQWFQEVSANLKRDGLFGIIKIFVSCGKYKPGTAVCSKEPQSYPDRS